MMVLCCLLITGGWWSLAPPLEHRLCFVFATGDSRRGGGAARVSGLVELLSLLLGCLALLGYTSSPGAWPVGCGVDPLAVRRLGDYHHLSRGDSVQPLPPY